MDEPSCSSVTSQEPIPASEESGWTSYFEDFLASEKRSIGSSTHGDDSSMVSDAASSAGWKNPLFLAKPLQTCEKLISFKTKKARRVSDEDPLKDTASSPVNSPKVSGEFSQFDMNAGKKGSTGDSSQVMALEKEEEEETGSKERVHDCLELRKRGLCLVALLPNFLG